MDVESSSSGSMLMSMNKMIMGYHQQPKGMLPPHDVNHLVHNCLRKFKEKFSMEPEIITHAPGRVNLIGEHTDYNEGFVLPFAIPYRTIIMASKVNGSCESTPMKSCILTMKEVIGKSTPDSSKFEEVCFDMCNPTDMKRDKSNPTCWTNYIKGVISQYKDEIPKNAAFNAVIISDIPIGSGLSSSAALETAMALVLERLYCITIEPTARSLRCMQAEHDYTLTPCGLMDQFASGMSLSNHFMLIDCRTQEVTHIPFYSNKNYKKVVEMLKEGNILKKGETTDEQPIFVLINSNVKHTLASTEYPNRVKQCKQAVDFFKKKVSNATINSLRDVTHEMLEQYSQKLAKINVQRVRHVLDENDRTNNAVNHLLNHNYKEVGKLMKLSHESLMNDYDVSCKELNFLVSKINSMQGVYGCRMTGGGFGGCVISLVDNKENALKLIEEITPLYEKEFNMKCDSMLVLPSHGCGYLNVKKVMSGEDLNDYDEIYEEDSVSTESNNNYISEKITYMSEKFSFASNISDGVKNFFSSNRSEEVDMNRNDTSDNDSTKGYFSNMSWFVPSALVTASVLGAVLIFNRKKLKM